MSAESGGVTVCVVSGVRSVATICHVLWLGLVTGRWGFWQFGWLQGIPLHFSPRRSHSLAAPGTLSCTVTHRQQHVPALDRTWVTICLLYHRISIWLFSWALYQKDQLHFPIFFGKILFRIIICDVTIFFCNFLSWNIPQRLKSVYREYI